MERCLKIWEGMTIVFVLLQFVMIKSISCFLFFCFLFLFFALDNIDWRSRGVQY